MVVAEGISILCAIAEKKRFDFVACLGEPVMRHIKAGDFKLWQDLFHLVEKKSLAAADIQHFRAVLQAVNINEGLGHRLPAALDELVSAVAVAPVAVPIIEFV